MRIEVADPLEADVLALQERHLGFARAQSPPEDVHALEPAELRDVSLTLYAARADDGRLLGLGALKELDRRHVELKSMHTDLAARGRGVGSAVLAHLLAAARARGYTRVSLETGTMAAFAPARALYARSGFTPCAPFGDYTDSPHSVCMTLAIP